MKKTKEREQVNLTQLYFEEKKTFDTEIGCKL